MPEVAPVTSAVWPLRSATIAVAVVLMRFASKRVV
jgi:hypothetical protein